MEIIKLYADWCGPCKTLENQLNSLGIEHKSVNIESSEGEPYLEKYNIMSVPTLLVLDDEGNLTKKYSGVADINKLKSFLYE